MAKYIRNCAWLGRATSTINLNRKFSQICFLNSLIRYILKVWVLRQKGGITSDQSTIRYCDGINLKRVIMQSKDLLQAIINELDDLKAINVIPLDVHKLTSITDYMIIATGTSSRHVCAIADKLVRHLKAKHVDIIGLEGDMNNEWVLVDFGDAVVHVMQQRTREFYQLEKLWSPSFTHTLALA